MTDVRRYDFRDEAAVCGIVLRVRDRYGWPGDVILGDVTSVLAWLNAREHLDRLVALADGVPVAYASSYRIPETDPALPLWLDTTHGRAAAQLAGIGSGVTDPDLAGSGAGTRLLADLVRRSRERGLIPVTATLAHNDHVERLLDRHGFSYCGDTVSREGDPVSCWAHLGG